MATIAYYGSPSDTNSPVQILPPEILGNIFGLVITACKQSYDFNIPRSSYITWYSFTFVSRYWRSVALNTPHIWGTLLFINKKVLSVMLQRSKMADLSIYAGIYHQQTLSSFVDIINDHTSRVTEISLKVGWPTFLSLLEELQRRPPSLRPRELRLQLFNGSSQSFPNSILVPDRLQVLEAHGIKFSWELSQSFPCLTDLIFGPNNSKVPLPEFITALRGMPSLELLCLRDCLPLDPSVSFVRAHLARLRKLDITSTQGCLQLANFLEFITIPATTDIRIYCINNRSFWLSAFQSSLHALVRGPHLEDEGFDGCYHKKVWIRPMGDGLNIIASRTDIETDPFPKNFDLTIKLVGCNHEETLHKMFPVLLRERIVSLRLEIGVRRKILLELFDTPSLPRLRNVTLAREGMPNFIAFMMLEKRSPLPFQNIRRLILYDSKFYSSANGGLEVRELRHCVEGRSKTIAKLEKLTVLRCYGILSHNIQRLRETVDVEWDEFESRLI